MIKTVELRKLILTTLRAVHPRVWFQDAPDGAVYPYIIYDLPNAPEDGYMERFILDVDGWDAPADNNTLPLETLMDQVDKVLNGLTVEVGGVLTFIVYRDNRIALKDDVPAIKRRKYVYQVRTFERR